MRPACAVLAGGCIAASLLAPSAAQAQTSPGSALVVERSCAGRPGLSRSPADLIRAMLFEAGVAPPEIGASDRQGSAEDDRRLFEALRTLLATPQPEQGRLRSVRSALNRGVNELEDRLNVRPGRVTVTSGPVSFRAEATPAWQITCPAAREPDPDAVLSRFALRETAEELWLTGAARRKAGAFALAFEQSRSVADDGTRTTETSLTVDGTLGFRLTDPGSRTQAYLFGTYNLQHDRSRPPPTLAPGESESDGDTDALAVGIDARLEDYSIPGFPLEANIQGAAIFDFANDAERLRLQARVTPRPDRNLLGICNTNSFTEGGIRGRCELSAEAQASFLTRRGTGDPGDYDTYYALGGRASIEFFLPTAAGDAADTGFLASLTYRYLAVFHGTPADIERVEARLSHRFWTGANAGVDLRFTYANGTNELSLEDEDILTFGVGLIF